MPRGRPDYIFCIAETDRCKIGQSLCGREIGHIKSDSSPYFYEDVFESIDHWFIERTKDCKIIACKRCIERLEEILRIEHYKYQEKVNENRNSKQNGKT